MKCIRNILVYCYEYPPIGGGAGNALAHLARVWASMGSRVTVVTSHYNGLPLEEFVDGVNIIRERVGRKYIDRGRAFEMIRYMIASLRSSDKIYRSVKPDLVVAFMTLPSGVAAARLNKIHGVPLIVELRGGDVPGFLPEKLRLLHGLTHCWIRNIWRESSLVIANSEGLAELAQKTTPDIPIRVLPNGVDTRVFAPGNATKAKKGLCRCIFVGRLVDEHKKISSLIRAIHRLPELELAVVGGGPDETRLKKAAANGPGFGRIIFKSWIKGASLIRELQSADVYVSASAWEGMPNSALEAMACGLPLVLSRISGHRELVVEGENGFLFDPTLPEELAECLSRLAADPDRRHELGLASRRRALQHFDWEPLAASHLHLYQQAL